jgi:hypothetical protein
MTCGYPIYISTQRRPWAAQQPNKLSRGGGHNGGILGLDIVEGKAVTGW